MAKYTSSDLFVSHRVSRALEVIEYLRPTNSLWYGPQALWGFRGQSKSCWPLIPSAFREDWEKWLPVQQRSNAGKDVEQQHDNEWAAFCRFFKLADETGHYIPGGERVRSQQMEQLINLQLRSSAWPFDELVEGLAIAQHHGVPTRLLDFTYGGLIAAFFAADDAVRQWKITKRESHFSIWAVNLAFIEGAWGNYLNRRLRIVEVPLARNPFLRAQRGFFVYDSKAFSEWKPAPINEVMLQHALLPSTWDRISDLGARSQFYGPPIIHRFDVPYVEAYELLSVLYQSERISRAHLMPTLDNVSSTLLFMDKIERGEI